MYKMMQMLRKAILMLGIFQTVNAGMIDFKYWGGVAFNESQKAVGFSIGVITPAPIIGMLDNGQTLDDIAQGTDNALCDFQDLAQYYYLTRKVTTRFPVFVTLGLVTAVFTGVSTLYWAYLGSLQTGIMLSFVCFKMISLIIAYCAYNDPDQYCKYSNDYAREEVVRTLVGLATMLMYNNFKITFTIAMFLAKLGYFYIYKDDQYIQNYWKEYFLVPALGLIINHWLSIIIQNSLVFRLVFSSSYASKFVFWISSILYSLCSWICFGLWIGFCASMNYFMDTKNNIAAGFLTSFLALLALNPLGQVLI